MRKIDFSPPDISQAEIDSVVNVLKSGWITTGPKTKEFENKIAKFCGTDKAVCLNSATACLELILRILGIGKGDEVITSVYTYSASCSVICHVGATPVLVDTSKNSFEMDYDFLEKAITEKTKAIIPVDIAGKMCDYRRILDLVKVKENLFCPKNKLQEKIGRIAVIADGAHSFGAEKDGVRSGNAADFTAFSFHAVKNLTSCEGGAVTWRSINEVSNDDIYKEFMLYALHGQSKDALEKTKLGSWEYDILFPGYKCNMTDVLAAIGLAQFSRYEKLLAKRKKIIEKYDFLLRSEPVDFLKHFGADYKSSGHLYLVNLLGKKESFRNNLIKLMAERGVATNVHYKPLPLLSAYKNLGFKIEDFPEAFARYENEITLPLHTLLSDEDVFYIIDIFKECFYA